MTENIPVELRREHIKRTHLSRRDSEVRRAERELLAAHIAQIQAEVKPATPSTGPRLKIAERYCR